jgi:hypothetical protein
MMNPDMGNSRVADRLREAEADRLAKSVKPKREGITDRTITGLLITWAVFMAAMVGLYTWMG